MCYMQMFSLNLSITLIENYAFIHILFYCALIFYYKQNKIEIIKIKKWLGPEHYVGSVVSSIQKRYFKDAVVKTLGRHHSIFKEHPHKMIFLVLKL